MREGVYLVYIKEPRTTSPKANSALRVAQMIYRSGMCGSRRWLAMFTSKATPRVGTKGSHHKNDTGSILNLVVFFISFAASV